jgi:hypothetical protein
MLGLPRVVEVDTTGGPGFGFEHFKDLDFLRPKEIVLTTTKLEKRGKGVILMHDVQHAMAEALPELLAQLKTSGYKVVHMVPKAPLQTLAEYDELVKRENKLPTVNERPTSSVVHTISEIPQ